MPGGIFSALQAENAALRSALAAAEDTIRQQQEALTRLEARLAEIEQGKMPPWAKAQTPRERPAKERTKRAPERNAGRRCETPTRIVEHA